LRSGKLRNVSKWYEEIKDGLDSSNIVKAGEVSLPPYYPDHQAFRTDWARYMNSVQYTDTEVGNVLDSLKEQNLLQNTVIFFLTDHGISQARGKEFLYEEGTHIPFVMWSPNQFENTVRADLVIYIDMVATSLKLTGIEIPVYMHARLSVIINEEN